MWASLFRKKTIDKIISDQLEVEKLAGHSMIRNLGVRDLTFMGVAAIIGASIFSAIGQASANGGPAVSLLFVFTALACMFTAFCYARFAATVPISGSAYTYTYATMGELLAWVIGWDLILEYAVGAATVGIAWSEYLNNFLVNVLHLSPIPYSLSHSPFQQITDPVTGVVSSGIINLPALFIVLLIDLNQV